MTDKFRQSRANLVTALSFMVLAAASGGVFAADTLPILLDRARAYDAEFRAAAAARDAGVELRAIGRAQLLPSLAYTYTQSRSNLERSYSNGASPLVLDGTPSTFTFSLSQSLVDFSKWASYQEEDARARLADLGYILTSSDLTLRLMRSYFDNLLALDNLRLAREQKNATSAQREQATRLREAGALSVTDVADTRAREMQSIASVAEAEYALRLRRAELSRMVGADGAFDLAAVGSFIPAEPEPNDLSYWLNAADQGNPKINYARTALEIARHGTQRAHRADWPSLDLVASSSRTLRSNDYTPHENGFNVGVRLTVPLLDGGRSSATAARATALRNQSEAELDNVRRETAVRVTEAFMGVSNARAKIEAFRLAVEAAELALRGATAGRLAGVRTHADVLNALQLLFQVRRDYDRERYGYLSAGVQLKALCGNLNGEDLSLPAADAKKN